jgi:hypothetical protein
MHPHVSCFNRIVSKENPSYLIYVLKSMYQFLQEWTCWEYQFQHKYSVRTNFDRHNLTWSNPITNLTRSNPLTIQFGLLPPPQPFLGYNHIIPPLARYWKVIRLIPKIMAPTVWFGINIQNEAEINQAICQKKSLPTALVKQIENATKGYCLLWNCYESYVTFCSVNEEVQTCLIN